MYDTKYRSDSSTSPGRESTGGSRTRSDPGKQTLTSGLPPQLATHASAQLGQDFSSVSVHEDGSPERLGTSAYARGDALYFASGQYQPHTAEGVAKIGHELGHVAQQRAGRVQPTGMRGDVPVNTNPALEREADAAGTTVAQGLDINALFGFGAYRGSGPATGIAQGADLAPDAPATAPTAAPAATPTAAAAPAATAATPTAAAPAAPAAAPTASAPPTASPVPPEVLARVGAEFLHADDHSAERHYRITPGGGFLLIAASDGAGVGKLEFRQDNKYRDAWTTLADYVVNHQAEIPPTAASTAPASPAAGPAAAAPDPWSLEGMTSAVGNGLAAAGHALVGAVESGVALLGGGVQAIEDAIASFVGATPAEPTAGTTPAPAPGATPAPGPGATPAPAAPPKQPTTTALVGSVGTGGANQPDDVTLVQDHLSRLGYACTATGSLDDATERAIGQYQAALVAHTGSSNLVEQVDGLISKGGATEKSLFGGSPFRFTPMPAGAVKENTKTSEAAGAIGQVRTYWDNILAVWAAVSPYLPDGSNLQSGYRSYEDQVRVIEDFFTRETTDRPKGYKDEIIRAHGEAAWQALVGKTDEASVETKRSWVKACGQDVAAPGTSPHQSGHAIDVGGADDIGQIHALLRYRVDADKTKVTKIIHEKNGCVHFEFAP